MDNKLVDKLSDYGKIKSMKRDRKKSSYDYPRLEVRMSPEEKEDIVAFIEEVLGLYKSTVGEEEKTYTKKEIILTALRIGLKNMKTKVEKKLKK